MTDILLDYFHSDTIFLFLGLLLGVVYGILAQRKQFCFSGAIKDIVLFNQKLRTASLLLSVITAVILTQIFSYFFSLDLSQSRYFININYIFIVLGGVLFGIGMMISDGCSSRHLIKASQGEWESIPILISLGVFSYITYSLFVTYNDQIYSNSLIESTTLETVTSISIWLILAVLSFLLYKSINKIKYILQCWDGVSIGIIIATGWLVTTYFAQDLFIQISAQSLSFVYPLGEMIEFTLGGFDLDTLSFATYTVVGVVLGAFISSRFNEQYSKKQMCSTQGLNPVPLWGKVVGAALMGIGGILAVGCTVGQGLSGLSSLSVASIVAIISIYTSAYFTAKYLHKKNALIACFMFDFKD